MRHPLQAFDPRNFEPAALVPGHTWSFEPVTLAGARALTGPRAEPGPFLAGPLPPLDERIVEVEDLVRFVGHPVRAFLRRRLEIDLRDFSTEIEDDLPLELDGLGWWGVGQRLLDALLAGIDGHAAIVAEVARGTLPPAVLGRPVIEDVYPIASAIAAAAGQLGPPGESIDVRAALPGGRRLSGTVAGVRGDVLSAVTFSRVGPKHRLAAWVRLLALTAARPERRFEAVTVGRAGRSAVVSRIAPVAPEPAREQVEVLVDLHDRGMREPLPLYCETSAAYAGAGGNPSKCWEGGYDRDGESAEPEHRLVLGGTPSFEELVALAPRSDEAGEGWDASEEARVGRLARRLWAGLLAVEEMSER